MNIKQYKYTYNAITKELTPTVGSSLSVNDSGLYTVKFQYPVSSLGIQAYPGFTFVINNSNWDISIGKSGIYEIDLQGIGIINNITFKEFNPPNTGIDVKTLLIDFMEVS